MNFERYVDKSICPTEEEIRKNAGDPELWISLKNYLKTSYEIIPEYVFYGKNYGWTVRYRKNRKTLCSLFPEYGAFSVLIVLGKKEVEKAMVIADTFSGKVRDVLMNTEQLHDGRWLWIRPGSQAELNDIIEILKLKRKPKKPAI
jgi:hypothetical protein